jgi:allantoinase
MALDPAYLDYPRRRHGYDHDLYTWSAIRDRPPVAWPGGKRVAVWICVSLEWFPIVPSDTPFRAPGHMQTAYPDFRHYTAREYGTRIGIYRLLEACAQAGVKVSFATNGAIAERYPELVREVVAAGHEIVAHSTDMNGTIASGLAETEERALIARSLDALEAVAGTRPSGWLSIARSQSWNTVRLLREAGLTYCCDWPNDELPWRFANGLVNLPLNHELSDRQVIAVQQQSVDSYARQLEDACDWLADEAERFGGRMLPIHLTPYISGLPYRIDAIAALIARLAARDDTWVATGGEIVAAWEGQQ